MAIEFIVFIPTTLLAADFHQYLLFIGFNAILFVHVFTHLAQSIILKMYTPGIVTAIFVVLSYTMYLFNRLYQAGMLNWTEVFNEIPIRILLLPLILFGHFIGKKMVPNKSC